MKSVNKRAPATLSLPDAVLDGIVQPSVVVQMAMGSKGSKGRIRDNPSAGTVLECCVIDVDIGDNTVRLAVAGGADTAAGADIKPGTPVTLAFTARAGLYVGSGPITEVSSPAAGDRAGDRADDGADDGMEMVVALNRLNYVEERECIRVRIPGATATCRTAGREVFTCRIIDLSAKGVKIEGEDELIPGTDIDVEMEVPPFPRFRAGGKVVWQALFRPGTLRTGIQFTSLTPALRSRLGRLCTFYTALTSRS